MLWNGLRTVPRSAVGRRCRGRETATQRGVDLNGDREVISATFSGVSNFANYILNNNTLTLSSGNITSTGSGSHTINSNVVLGAAGDWSIGDTSTVGVNGVVSGGFQLTKSGAGTLTLSATRSASSPSRASSTL